MATTTGLIADNIRYLEQALTLLRDIDDVTLTYVDPPRFASGVGAHLRHNLDHFRSFLDGLDTRRIDYDARERDVRIEINGEYAAEKIGETIARLQAIASLPADTPLQVKMDCGEDAKQWCRSTVARELEFLVSHTVHHYALVAMILRLQGLEPGAEFGVAPSTLRFQHQLSCALQAG